MLIDTSKFPLPSANTEPGFKSWMAYLETIRPLVEGEYFARLTRDQKQVAGLRGGIEYPALEQVVPFDLFNEKLRAAKVLAWEMGKAGYAAEAKARYQPVLVNGKKSVRGVFDFSTWTWDEAAQFTMWEKQLADEAIVAPLRKYDLFVWATQHLLPLVGKKAPTVWAVYCFLLVTSPEPFQPFKVSNRKLAKGAGVSPRSVPDAVDHLHALGLVRVKKGAWSPKGPQAAILPVYEITPLVELKKLYL
jgi:hypothetical protein